MSHTSWEGEWKTLHSSSLQNRGHCRLPCPDQAQCSGGRGFPCLAAAPTFCVRPSQKPTLGSCFCSASWFLGGSSCPVQVSEKIGCETWRLQCGAGSLQHLCTAPGQVIAIADQGGKGGKSLLAFKGWAAGWNGFWAQKLASLLQFKIIYWVIIRRDLMEQTKDLSWYPMPHSGQPCVLWKVHE